MTASRWVAIRIRVLVVVSVAGLIACGPREPSTDAERLARGRKLVQQMSARLAAATALSVTTTEVRDVVRGAGKKETVSLTGTYTMRRPDRFHTRVIGGQAFESWYNGKVLTIAAHDDKVFAQAPMPENVDRTLDALAERYDMALPLADLFHSSPVKALLSETTAGGYAGTETVGSAPCSHLSFHDVGVDWELWVPVQGDPLPARFKVTQKRRTGQPVADVTFTKWNVSPQIYGSRRLNLVDDGAPDSVVGRVRDRGRRAIEADGTFLVRAARQAGPAQARRPGSSRRRT